MKGTPVDGLDGGLMLAETSDGLRLTGLIIFFVSCLPDHKLVIISSGSEHILVVVTPSQPTNLLSVAN